MAVYFLADSPEELLEAFDAAIDLREIKTWVRDQNGDYRHTSERWAGEMYFHTSLAESGVLGFQTVTMGRVTIDRKFYAYHVSRLVQTFLNNFPHLFTCVHVSSEAEDYDEGTII